jgi:murein DD-endopeptidase MepM/ murein hydrolase activator NlpD
VVGAAAVTVAAAAAAVQGGAWATAGATAASASVSTPVSLPTVAASAGQPGGETRTQLARERQVRISRDSSRQVLQDSTGKGTLKAPGNAERKQSNGDVVRLAASAERVAGQVRKDAWQLPIPRGVYHLTARFGQCSGLWSHCHTGLDFAAPTGTPIHAVAGGKVTEVGWAGAYGNRTEIRLEDGTVLWYCHQDSIAVRAGQRVFGGQVIGAVGSTGNTTGPHLHLEVRPGGGDPVDPYRALSVRGVTP